MPQTILITGASSGIGLASAQLFHQRGWNVIATMRTPESDTKLKELDPSRMLVTRLDLQDKTSINPAILSGIEKFTTIDVVLNNAGYGQNGIFEAMTPEQIQAQFDVNVFGVMDVIRAILPIFARTNVEGSLIKFALEGFTEALSYELASQNIFVKSVVPHGGVTGNNFVARFMRDAAVDSTLTSYDAFLAKTATSYKNMVAAAAVSSEDVAELIYAAATDGSDKLRYFIGDDKRGFLKARYESKNDDEYIAYMRSFFK
ncbi:short-chain dehydrogenase reductase SDR [Rhodocollybia butyracea]|uniref:Short-chain dehydrogenase reductase SDR n=1 Tax=Rhodocollybia butyracea TaxID=206335 RepID=A0A9P5UBC3_9AGAR|nr:short-chain dehydrogenase reductase SDR [Rhodocollybia butyracea]